MIFLSASIPYRDRDRKYFYSADIVAIRDAVRALSSIVIPQTKLVWGGHPSITPLIRYIMLSNKIPLQDHVTLYQSDFFRAEFPLDNYYFERMVTVPAAVDRASSLADMRMAMIADNKFTSGVFIGGMEGVELEFELFRRFHPAAAVFPIASTGAAAKMIYDRLEGPRNTRLLEDYAYMALFRSLLPGLTGD